MCLDVAEADQIIELAQRKERIVAVDMHKRFDPDHLRIRDDIKHRIGEPLMARRIWRSRWRCQRGRSNGWSKATVHVCRVALGGLAAALLQCKPVSLTAVGQKKRLVREGINAYDAVQVRVDFDNGMSIQFNITGLRRRISRGR